MLGLRVNKWAAAAERHYLYLYTAQGAPEISWEKKRGNWHTFKMSHLQSGRTIGLNPNRRRCKSSNWILFVRKSLFCTNLQNPINDWCNISLFRLLLEAFWLPRWELKSGYFINSLSPKSSGSSFPIPNSLTANFSAIFIIWNIQAVLRWCLNPLRQIDINIGIGLDISYNLQIAGLRFLNFFHQRRTYVTDRPNKESGQMHPLFALFAEIIKTWP